LRPGTLQATYLLETPLDPAKVAEVLAGEQSSGTFVRVAGETDDLRARSRAPSTIEGLDRAQVPSLPTRCRTQRNARPLAACA
jgi:ribulose-bisphosphate carboxylase large chain